MMMIRTSGLKAIAATALFLLAAGPASADEKRHGTSLLGELKYGPDFKQFGYVNPDAPKGGSARMWAMGTFDSFNLIPNKGNKAAGVGLIYDTLMAASMDESSSEYGQIAEWVSYPEDFSSVTYKIRD